LKEKINQNSAILSITSYNNKTYVWNVWREKRFGRAFNQQAQSSWVSFL